MNRFPPEKVVAYLDRRDYLIQKLEQTLEAVRSGEITGMAWVVTTKDGLVKHGWDFSKGHDGGLCQGAADLHFAMLFVRHGTTE